MRDIGQSRYEEGINKGMKGHVILAGFQPPDHTCAYKAGGESCDRSTYAEGKLCKLHTDLAWYKRTLVSA